jgi:hypothetical protein
MDLSQPLDILSGQQHRVVELTFHSFSAEILSASEVIITSHHPGVSIVIIKTVQYEHHHSL